MCLGRESSYPPRDLANRALSSTTLVFLVIMVAAAAVTLDHQGCTACPSSRARGRPPFLGEAVHLLREDWFVRFQGVEGGEGRGRRPGELLKRTQVYLCFFKTSANQRAFLKSPGGGASRGAWGSATTTGTTTGGGGEPVSALANGSGNRIRPERSGRWYIQYYIYGIFNLLN